jgi:uncharacterized SAM-binding protein YcdF (DUF218 family)
MRRLRGWLLRVAFLGLGFAIVVLGWAAIARNSAPTANTDRTRFDALIVLGDPADADGNPTPKQLARVNEAVREYERGVAPHIILTGGAVRSRFVEAEVMARAAQAEGIPSSAIVIEGKALDTIQNLCYSTRILQQKGWSSAEIISSASHLPRTALIAEEMPIEWRTHPAPPLTPAVGSRLMFAEAIEELKTVHFLLWARLRERCQP